MNQGWWKGSMGWGYGAESTPLQFVKGLILSPTDTVLNGISREKDRNTLIKRSLFWSLAFYMLTLYMCYS